MKLIVNLTSLLFFFIAFAQPTGTDKITGDSLYFMGDYIAAIAYYKKLPPKPSNLYLLGRTYEVASYKDEAIFYYQKSLDEDAGYQHSRFRLAKLYTQTFQLDKAKEKLQFLINEDTTNARYYYQMGLVALKANS